jgi:hypothetical protein
MRYAKVVVCAVLVALSVFEGCSSDDAKDSVLTYESIGPFSEGLAPVKLQGKWGFIDTAGKVVIPAQYDAVTGFRAGLAGFESLGRWGLMDQSGQPIDSFTRRFFQVRPFSEGLAPVQERPWSLWEYVDKEGRTVIPALYEDALPFSEGLAPVLKDGKWRYIGPDGSEAFATDFYRVYPFTSEGLALVRPARNGKYGYIERDGKLSIAANYDEAKPFADGLAAVRTLDKWGYIDPSGKWSIQPTYDYASSFSDGVAAVLTDGGYGFITNQGKQALPNSFKWASPFSDERALVLANGMWSYIDALGNRLGIAQAPVKAVEKPNDCTEEGIQNAFQGGFARFQIVNVDSPAWTISLENGEQPYTCLPGFPLSSGLKQSGDPDMLDHLSFIFHFPPGWWKQGSLFDLVLTSQDGNGTKLTLSTSNQYVQPPPAPGHPFFEYLKGSVKILKSLALAATGREFMALYNFSVGVADISIGAVDSSGTNNELPPGTGTFLVTTLKGETSTGVEFAPIDGSFCGGDEYAISDGYSLAVDMTASRSGRVPGEVDVTLYRLDRFYALKAAKRLDDWRHDTTMSYISPPYDQIMKRTFANYGDLDDSDLCRSDDGTQGYLPALSTFSTEDLINFWYLANNFGTMCSQTKGGDETWCEYFAKLLPCSCGN